MVLDGRVSEVTCRIVLANGFVTGRFHTLVCGYDVAKSSRPLGRRPHERGITFCRRQLSLYGRGGGFGW